MIHSVYRVTEVAHGLAERLVMSDRPGREKRFKLPLRISVDRFGGWELPGAVDDL